jgi:hypothetical protein
MHRKIISLFILIIWVPILTNAQDKPNIIYILVDNWG